MTTGAGDGWIWHALAAGVACVALIAVGMIQNKQAAPARAKRVTNGLAWVAALYMTFALVRLVLVS